MFIAAVPSHVIVDTLPKATPWWYIPVTAGVMSGAVTLLGVLIAQYVTLRIDRKRREREDLRRFDQELREVCVRLVRRRTFAYRGPIDTAMLTRDDLKNLDEMQELCEELELIAPAPIDEAASRVSSVIATALAQPDKDLADLNNTFEYLDITIRDYFRGTNIAAIGTTKPPLRQRRSWFR